MSLTQTRMGFLLKQAYSNSKAAYGPDRMTWHKTTSSRHDNWLANDLAQQASGYHVSRSIFFISEKPMLACTNFTEANIHIADSLRESAGQEVPCQGSALLSELDGGEKSEDLHGSDVPEKSDDGGKPENNKVSDWREPIIAYLQIGRAHV